METKTEKGSAAVAEQPQTAQTALQPAPAQPPATQRQSVPVRMGVAPTSIEEAWRLAGFFAQSEMVPKQYRGKQADVLVAIQYGMELGFAPMQALQSIAVINGRPGVFGDGFIALIVSSPLCREHDEYYQVGGERRDGLTLDDLKKDDTAAVCTFWRHGRSQPITRRFSIGQAKKASLLGKEGPWSNYPDRMLMMRARGFAGRDAFPDLLRGIKTAEELHDTPDEDAIDTTAIRHEPQQPRRASEARADTSPQQATPPATTPAAPGTAPSAPAAESVTDIARGLKVTKTAFVRPKQGEPYYEVTMASTTGKPVVFLTRDEAVYKEAASFESTDHMVVAGYHVGESAAAKVLDRLSIYEGPADSGDLFD